MKLSRLAGLLLYSASTFSALPPGYRGFTAEKKLEALWHEVTNSPRRGHTNFIEQSCAQLMGVASLLPGGLAPILVRSTDPVPRGHGGDEVSDGRIKVIHEKGMTVRAIYRSTGGHSISGLLSEKNAYMLIRISQAAPMLGKIGLAPGLSMKWFIDGEEWSRNLVAMYRLDPQLFSNNPFRHDFTHILPFSPNPLMWLGELRFALAKWNPRTLWAGHLAEIYTDGSVPEIIIPPEQLILRPNPELSAIQWLDGSYLDEFLHLGPGYELYTVFNRSRGGIETKIGSIIMTGSFISSEYGDKNVNYPHFLKPRRMRLGRPLRDAVSIR